MHTKVQDLTIEELRALISDSIKDAMTDLIEDITALSIKEYINSIAEARKDYKEGRIKKLAEVIDV